MKTISIRELHLRTGQWVRQAATGQEPLVILDRGRPAARLMALEEEQRTPFAERRLVDGFEQLPQVGADSGRMLEEDRR
jgi:prevent-host-death family protein